jgi:hypothetical protein
VKLTYYFISTKTNKHIYPYSNPSLSICVYMCVYVLDICVCWLIVSAYVLIHPLIYSTYITQRSSLIFLSVQYTFLIPEQPLSDPYSNKLILPDVGHLKNWTIQYIRSLSLSLVVLGFELRPCSFLADTLPLELHLQCSLLFWFVSLDKMFVRVILCLLHLSVVCVF